MRQYFDLGMACLLFSLQFVFSKNYARRSAGNLHAGLWNGLAVALSMMLYLFPMNGFAYGFSASAWLFSSIYVACSIGMTVVNVAAMRMGDLSVVTTYILLGGMILPFLFGVTALNETCSPLKIVAILLLMVSLLPPLLAGLKKSEDEKTAGKKRGGLLFHGLCFGLFLANGLVSIVTKAHTIAEDAIEPSAFTLLCATEQAAVLLLILLGAAIVRRKKGDRNAFHTVFLDPAREKPTAAKTRLLLLSCSFGYAVCNGVANLFSQSCAKTMDASIQFPVLSAVIIVLTAILGRVVFGEKIRRASELSLLLSCGGIVLFMLG